MAMAAAARAIVVWEEIMTLARSKVSATTPAGRARTRRGSIVEAIMSPTQVADPPVSSFMSHEAATV